MAGFSWPPDTREKMAVTAAYAKPVANAKNTILMPYTAEPHVEKAKMAKHSRKLPANSAHTRRASGC